MKQLLLICAVVALVGRCASINPIVEKAIREELEKPTGELTKADLEKVTRRDLSTNKLTSVKGLEKLHLTYNPDLTKAQIDELQKALPKCGILSNPTK